MSFREVDRDNSIQLGNGESSSGTLQWAIDSNQENGEYILRVKSDNDTEDARVYIAPSSVIAQYDATQEASTGDVTSVPDRIGGYDLSGGCSVISSGINGKQTYRFDGTGDAMVNSTIANQQELAVISVWQLQSLPGSGSVAIYDSDSDSNRYSIDYDAGNDQYRLYHGSVLSGGAGDTNAHLTVHQGVSGGDYLEQDGTTIISGDAGNGYLDGISVGADRNQDRNAQIDFGEIVVLDAPTDQDISDEKTRLSDKWGITI